MQRRSLFVLSFAFLLSFLISLEAGAVSTKVWRETSQQYFLKGHPDGVAVTSRGTFLLAPALEEVVDCEEPFLWSLAVAPDGSVILGTGSNGKVMRWRPGGKPEELAVFKELEVFAVAAAGDDVYAATSPHGKIYRIPPGGKPEVYFEPKEVEYIWALLPGKNGVLYAGTGSGGEIYKIAGKGEGAVFFDSQEPNILCLTADGRGGLYAGSDGNGLIFHVSEDGKASVVYDAPLREVRQIALGENGALIAVLNSGPAVVPAPPAKKEKTTVSTGADVSLDEQDSGEGSSVTITVTPESSGATTEEKKGRIVLIQPESGGIQTLYESQDGLIFSMILLPDHKTILAGAGEGLVRVTEPREFDQLYKFEGANVTAMVPDPKGGILLSTSGPSKVYRLGPGVRKSGEYLSPVKDSQALSRWGSIRWEEETPASSSVRFRFSTGNPQTPRPPWSDWTEELREKTGAHLPGTPARYGQWQLLLKDGEGRTSPEARSIEVSYLQPNLPPEVELVAVLPPGLVFSKSVAESGSAAYMPVPEELETMFKDLGVGGDDKEELGKRLYRKGARTVMFRSKDPNGDTLESDLYFRSSEETAWKPLRKDITKDVFSFDSGVLPDGQYVIKVVASDRRSNLAGGALEGERSSDLFLVDNTPPEIRELRTVKKDADRFLTFTVEDRLTPIWRVEYSVDARDFVLCLPEDGIADSTSERYSVKLPALASGEHTVIVRATDGQQNTTAGSVVIGKEQ